MTTHARPDMPHPDPIVHDQPGDVPLVPCPGEREDIKPGVPHADQDVADEEMRTN